MVGVFRLIAIKALILYRLTASKILAFAHQLVNASNGSTVQAIQITL